MGEVRRYSPECFVAHRNSPLRVGKTDKEIIEECQDIQETREFVQKILEDLKSKKADGKKPRLVDKIR